MSIIERKWISVALRKGQIKENNREKVFAKRMPLTGRFPNENSMRPVAQHRKIRPLLSGQLEARAGAEKDVLAGGRAPKSNQHIRYSIRVPAFRGGRKTKLRPSMEILGREK